MRIIDGDALTLLAVNDDNGIAVVRLEDIARQPTIDPEELRPKGEWVQEENSVFVHRYNCSVCNYYLIFAPTNYCPNCGAKMGGGE